MNVGLFSELYKLHLTCTKNKKRNSNRKMKIYRTSQGSYYLFMVFYYSLTVLLLNEYTETRTRSGNRVKQLMTNIKDPLKHLLWFIGGRYFSIRYGFIDTLITFVIILIATIDIVLWNSFHTVTWNVVDRLV